MRQTYAGSSVKFAIWAATLALPLFGAVEGTVINGTTGKPQADATVTLINLGKGMQTLASVKADAAGKFSFGNELEPGTPYLLQGLYEGVTYNRMLPPGTSPSGLQLQVYNAAAKSPDAKVGQHMILLEPSAGNLAVSETVIYTNEGRTTLLAPEGSLRFFVPSTVTAPVRVTVQGPQGMPVQRPAEKTNEPNTWVVKAPIKPGETRIDLSYSMPLASPANFASKVLHGGGAVRIVVPKGVKLDGKSVQNVGTHPQTQATIYEVSGNEYAVAIEGTGTLRDTVPQQETGEQPSGEDSGPGVEAAKPLIYRRLPWIVSLAMSMLGIGFTLLYRMGSPTR